MGKTKILITGATGYIGRRLKNSLLAHPEYQLRLFVRNARKVGERVSPQVEIVEGSWNPERLVILQFPSMEHARSFLKDPEYQAVAETRRASTTSHLLVAEGFPG